MRGIKETQKLSLGMPKAPQDNISISLKHLSLGMPPVGIPPFFFNNYRLVSVEPKFLLLHMMSAILEMSFYFILLAV